MVPSPSSWLGESLHRWPDDASLSDIIRAAGLSHAALCFALSPLSLASRLAGPSTRLSRLPVALAELSSIMVNTPPMTTPTPPRGPGAVRRPTETMAVVDSTTQDGQQPPQGPRTFQRDTAGRPWPHPLHRQFGRHAATCVGAVASVGGVLVSAAAVTASSTAANAGGAAGMGLSATIAAVTAVHAYCQYAHPHVWGYLSRRRVHEA